MPSSGRAAPETLAGAQRLERRSLPQRVVEQLLELISSSSAPELALPSERRLCAQLGVSRNVLREAVAALDGLGVTQIRGKTRIGSSARARAQLLARMPADTEREVALDPIAARLMLEPEIAAKAAKHADEADIAEISRWMHLMEEASDRQERIIEYDSAFHIAVARATGNHTLVQIVAVLTDANRVSRELWPLEQNRTAIEGHEAVVTALKNKDPKRARAAMRAHLKGVQRFIKASLPPKEEDS